MATKKPKKANGIFKKTDEQPSTTDTMVEADENNSSTVKVETSTTEEGPEKLDDSNEIEQLKSENAKLYDSNLDLTEKLADLLNKIDKINADHKVEIEELTKAYNDVVNQNTKYSQELKLLQAKLDTTNKPSAPVNTNPNSVGLWRPYASWN